MEVTSGFLIVKTFDRMYHEYLVRFEEWRKIEQPSAQPRRLEQMPGKYRGIDREPIQPWLEEFRGTGVAEPTEQELDVSLYMEELTKSGKADKDFFFLLDDAKKLIEMIPPPVEREIVWARRIDKDDEPPLGSTILGYDPTEFYTPNHSSIIAYTIFFPYRIGPDLKDPKGERAKIYYPKLNKYGLFDKPDHAREFVDSFPLLPEHERPDYVAEIRALAE